LSKKAETSRVYLNGDEAEFKPFSLEDFSKGAIQEIDKERELQEAFKPDFEGLAEKEFVLGGFNFDYHGGYRAGEIEEKSADRAKAMIESAQSRVDDIESEAREKGYKEGHDEGRDEGVKEVTEVMQTLLDVIQSLLEYRHEVTLKYEEEMIAMVMLAASEVVMREVEVDRDMAKRVIWKTVEDVHSRQKITIRVNPVDAKNVHEVFSEIVEKIEAVEGVSIKEDPTVTAGGSIVETNVGQLDATVENRLMSLYKNLKHKVHM